MTEPLTTRHPGGAVAIRAIERSVAEEPGALPNAPQTHCAIALRYCGFQTEQRVAGETHG